MAPTQGDSQLNRALNDYGVIGGDFVKLGQGQLTATGNPLDVALQGPGFFAVQAAAGVRYTRAGNFQRGRDGALRTSDNKVVLGINGAPIIVPPGQIDIGLDGTVSVAGGVAGRIEVVDFPKGTPLIPEGATLFRAPAQSATPATLHRGASGQPRGRQYRCGHQHRQHDPHRAAGGDDAEGAEPLLLRFDKTATEDLAKV